MKLISLDFSNQIPEEIPTEYCQNAGFLRHIGHGTYIWDIHYGEDSEFGTHENALLCLMKAPVPPQLLKRELIWPLTA